VLTVLPLLALALLPEDSVVRIQVYSARYDWQAPWRVLPVDSGVGSGFVIAGGKILTNAHVVRDARRVLIKKHHVANPFTAKVEAVGDDCDLALLSVEDPAFAKGVKPLAFGPLPKARSQVVTYGFPLGGQEVSSTKGIISRVEWKAYVHSQHDAHLVVQTDAAINPGNSGGPVVQNDKVVGVAFQGAPGLQDIGYFIPAPVVTHFLDDIRDGKYDGFPDSGFDVVDLVSPSLRKERRVPADKTGVVVDDLVPGGTGEGALKAGDVILAVEGQPVADDGTIELGDGRISFAHIFDMKQIGQPIKLTLLRDGKITEVNTPSRRVARGDRRRNRYNVAPKYYVYAGMVFMPLDREYLKTFGDEWPYSAPRKMIWEHIFREVEKPENADDETIVLTRVLAHPVNSEMDQQVSIVRKVNGVSVKKLSDLAAAVTEAREKKSRFIVFEYDGGRIEALETAEAESAHAAILKNYGISRDHRL
jgi:S1-C subfamily serine protease